MIADPQVSVLMCNYNCADYLPSSLKTALGQREISVEVIVIDDQSRDDSRAVVAAIAAQDPRVRLIVTPSNLGPAGARNMGLDAARGRWIAIQDSDDLVHLDRLSRLIKAAEARNAEVVADDLLIFHDDHREPATRFMAEMLRDGPREIALPEYVRSNGLYSKVPNLGYLKPVFRASLFKEGRFRYTESLRIAEDYDLVLRMLATGVSLHLIPELTYFYRKRNSSISHRLSLKTLSDMVDADQQFRNQTPDLAPEARAALDHRVASIQQAVTYERLITALKAKDPNLFIKAAVGNPAALKLLSLPVKARFHRLFSKIRLKEKIGPIPRDGKNLAFVSRQRIVGPGNGSSKYVLSIMQELANAGFRCHYIVPSGAVFGSIPLLKLGSEMQVFDTIIVHHGLRRGKWLVSLELKTWIRAVAAIASVGLLKLKIISKPLVGKAPYSISVPLTSDDALFLANNAADKSDIVLFDYAFLTECGPYLLRPEARSLVLMHDLLSSRQSQFDAIAFRDSVETVDLDTEVRLLGAADRVVAIQRDEGSAVSKKLGEHRVIVAPMAVQTAGQSYPGDSGHVLFVGSGTAPNVDGILWFLKNVWPGVRLAVPHAVLDIVGNVGRALGSQQAGDVVIHGLVGDLSAFYHAADVVVSPLRVGSGLKIKLVEALSYGKAIVATSVTCQGVEQLVQGSVIIEDDATRQTTQLVALLNDRQMRAQLASRALETAAERFGIKACYGEIIKFANGSSNSEVP